MPITYDLNAFQIAAPFIRIIVNDAANLCPAAPAPITITRSVRWSFFSAFFRITRKTR